MNPNTLIQEPTLTQNILSLFHLKDVNRVFERQGFEQKIQCTPSTSFYGIVTGMQNLY